MTKSETPLNFREVAFLLGVARSTLNGWLSADEERPAHERRFSFHSYRGRKRVWAEASFVKLERAIAAESEPGGCLAGWRSRHGSHAASVPDAATEAMLRVLGYYDGDEPAAGADGPGDADDAQPAAMKPK
jgi:hypothetical protein